MILFMSLTFMGPLNKRINYRQISLTSHMIKIVERIIREKVTTFLEDNNLIEETQHGSRSGPGTLTQLLIWFLEKIVKKKLVEHVKMNASFSSSLYSFRLIKLMTCNILKQIAWSSNNENKKGVSIQYILMWNLEHAEP